jgi:2',3'-cyclic-nucleotide 2'-phosphodiesterase (5'-nucleotidase family)
VNDVKVGIIGLTTIGLVNRPNLPEGIDILDYQDTLRDTVPMVMETGVDLLIVISHLCLDEIKMILSENEALDLDLFAGGHCHQVFSETVNDTVIFSSGWKFENYSFATFEVDIDDDLVEVLDFGTNANEGGESDPIVQDIIAKWHEAAESEMMTPIGYLQNALELGSTVLETLTVEVWLAEFLEADIALTHFNSIRDGLPQGDITINRIISALPFNNSVVQIKINGQDVLHILDERMESLAIGGLVREGNTWKLRKTGEVVDPDKIYTVLVDDFIYSGGDEFTFHEIDPEGVHTGSFYRQLFIDWIIAQDSSIDDPLDEAIASLVE